MNKTVIN